MSHCEKVTIRHFTTSDAANQYAGKLKADNYDPVEVINSAFFKYDTQDPLNDVWVVIGKQ